MKCFILVVAMFVEVQLTMESNVTLFMTPDSAVCPGDVVTIRCVLYSPEQQLLWICPEGGANGERSVFCNSGDDICDLECNQGIFSVSVLPCNDSDNSIISEATYIATTEIGSLTCADVTSVSINSSVQFGSHAPAAPVLSWVKKSNTDSNHSVTVYWNSPTDHDTSYNIFITPPPPQCSDPCVYRTDRASLSIVLQVGIEYNITGQADRCSGALSSSESAVLHVTLPDTMQKKSKSKDHTTGAVAGSVVTIFLVVFALIIALICIVCYWRHRKLYNQQNILWKRLIRNAPDPIEKGSVAVDVNRQIAYFSSIKTEKVWCYDVKKNRWSSLTCKEKENFSVAVIRGYGLTAVGGFAKKEPQKTLLCYQDQQWKNILPSMNKGRVYPAVITTDTCIIVASGKNEASVEIHVFGSNQWTYVSSLPEQPPYPIGTMYNGTIFLMDWDGNYYTCSLEVLTSTEQHEKNAVWSKYEYYSPVDKTKKVEHAAPVTINNRLFLVGGHTGRYNKVLNDINELTYNEHDNEWTCHPFATLPLPRFRCLAAALPGDGLLVVGGSKLVDRGRSTKHYNIAHLGKLR